jgi:hypothetical protein
MVWYTDCNFNGIVNPRVVRLANKSSEDATGTITLLQNREPRSKSRHGAWLHS